MKNLTFFIAAILLRSMVFAQVPQSFRYQAVARDNSGNVLTNLDISFRISILSGSVTGSIVYSETHTGITTNAFGLVELEIGKGTPVTGTFSSINWGNNSYFVKIEMDPEGGSAYQVLSTSQFMAVPYALHAKSVEGAVTKIDDLADGKSDGTGSSIFLGIDAGLNDDGSYNANVGIGFKALYSNTSGYNNTAIGNTVLYNNTTGVHNVANGYQALFNNTSGSYNTAIGSYTLIENTQGNGNTANGQSSLKSNTTGSYNTANGLGALYLNSTGSYNTANGVSALGSNTQGTGNTANGYYALFGNNGSYNVANGSEALFNNTTGNYNVANGSEALSNNSTGSGNVGNGYSVLNKNTTGYENTANGIQALLNNTIGNHNVANGSNALYFNTTGIDNTAIGSFAGFSNSLGNGGVFIGYQAGYNETISNRLYIENSDANANNALIYGEFGTNNTTTGNILRTNSEFQIGNPASTGYSFPMADGSINQILKTDGNGGLNWASTIEPTGLEALDEGNGIGWRLIGRDPAQYGNIGKEAIDLSIGLSGTETGATGYQSVAMGYETTASETNSTAMGYRTTASETSSTAMGHYTTASGDASTAMGANTTASGIFSTAIGYRTKAASYASMTIGKYNIGSGNPTSWVATDPLFEIGIGTGATSLANALTVFKNGTITAPSLTNDLINNAGARALTTKEYVDANASSGLEAIDEGNGIGWRLIGQNPDQYGNIGQGAVDLSMNSDTFEGATGNFSVAMGTSTHAYANYSTTMGVHTYASGNASTAMGSGTTASGSNSTAMGANTTASGNFSTAIGYTTKAASYASMTIGKYNIGSGNPASWVATDPVFEIGIGTSATSLANALTVLKNGNTSIGVNSPGSHKLYVKSSTGGVKGSTAFVENSSSTGLAMIVENTSASSTDNTLLVTTHGTGDIVSFDTYQGTNTWNRRFKFTNAGNGRCDGSWIGGGADYAEFFPKANNNAQYEPGDVIAISPEIGYSVESANTDNPNLIIGVYSTNPVVIGNSSAEEDPKNHVLVGLMGVVPTKVNLENGPIKIGDFLTISSTPGVAMKALKSGYMIGRAMESYSNGSQGKIKVLVESEWMDLEGELDALKKDNEVLQNTLNALKTEFDARLKHVEQTLNTAQQ